MRVIITCEKGNSLHRTSPKAQRPVNDCSGVKGTAKRHMTTSLAARLRMNRLVTEARIWRERATAANTRALPPAP